MAGQQSGLPSTVELGSHAGCQARLQALYLLSRLVSSSPTNVKTFVLMKIEVHRTKPLGSVLNGHP